MDTLTIVLLAMLALFFSLSAFLAMYQYETKEQEPFSTSPWSCFDGSQALLVHNLREKYFEGIALRSLPTSSAEDLPKSPNERIETSFSYGYSSGKESIHTPIDAKKQGEMSDD